jgi:SPP1 gp7 family putative phage head morphogenesis protein
MALRKRTNAYWEKRSLERLTAAERASTKHLRQIYGVYDEASRKTVESIKDLYRAYYKGDDGFDLQALKSIAAGGDIKRFRDEMKRLGLDTYLPKRYEGRMTRLELLNAQMWGEAKKVGLKQNVIQTAGHVETINDAYYHSIFDVSKGIGATPAFSQLNTRTVNGILNAKFEGKNYSERIWANTDVLAKQLQGKLGAAIASGQSQAKTVREIRERFGVSKYYAERLVRTETNYFENQAEIESYEAMGVEKYVFLATLDSHTSEVCRHNDGKIYNIKDATPGVNLPPMLPNCRSSIRPYLGEEWEPEARIARNPKTGRNYYVSGKTTYGEWAEAFGVAPTMPTLTPSILPLQKAAMGGGDVLNSQPIAKRINYPSLDDGIEEPLQKTGDEIYQSLSGNEKRVLDYYTDAGSSVFNKSLATGKEMYPEDIKDEKVLARILNKSKIGKNVTVYSGSSYPDGFAGLNVKAGGEFVIKPYVSASLKKSVAEEFASFSDNVRVLMEIRLPAKSKALYLGRNSVLKDDLELIIQKGTKFRVVSRKEKDGIIDMVLEVIK